MSQRVSLFAFALCGPLALGCKDDAITIVSGATAPSVSAAAVPVDHLAPGELLEGDVKAFGLKLPRGVRIDNAFSDVIFASGQVQTNAAINYVRTRVREGKMIQGDTVTTFDQVRVPALPDRVLVIGVHAAEGAVGTTKFELRDVTPTKAPELPDEAARWRAAGLKPNGQVLDPTHLQ